MDIGPVQSVIQVPKIGIRTLEGVWRDVDRQAWRIRCKNGNRTIVPGDWIVTEVDGTKHVLKSGHIHPLLADWEAEPQARTARVVIGDDAPRFTEEEC